MYLPKNERKTEIALMLDVNNEFSTLKKLLRSDDWPLATAQLCEDKNRRAAEILNYYVETDIRGTKFLSNENHVVELAAKQATLATEFEDAHGFYDVILLYDIIDHVDNPVEMMERVRFFSHPDTKVFVRCHPWCSRHGGHQYRQINKAFLHLIFDTNEIERLGVQLGHNFCNMSPQNTYRDLFRKTGFRQKHIRVVEDPIEPFFQNNKLINQRILKKSKETPQYNGNLYFPKYQISQSFVDFVLQILD